MKTEDLKQYILMDFQQSSHENVKIEIAKYSKAEALKYFKEPVSESELNRIFAREWSFLDDEEYFHSAVYQTHEFEIAPKLLDLLLSQDEKYNISASEILEIFKEIDANSEKIMNAVECMITWYFQR